MTCLSTQVQTVPLHGAVVLDHRFPASADLDYHRAAQAQLSCADPDPTVGSSSMEAQAIDGPFRWLLDDVMVWKLCSCCSRQSSAHNRCSVSGL